MLLINNVKDKAGLNDHELYLTRTWLGIDLFGQNKITLEDAHKETGNSTSTILTHQSRMHPEISAIARKHIYNINKEILQDQESRIPKDQLSQVKPFPGKHLILCDTSDASPIAIQPKSSRINIYRALCSGAIARQARFSLPGDHKQQGKQRIGIVTPYQKQSKLLQSLIIDAGLKEYIRVGTVHKFQGLEFDVVIFDTVESPPISPRFDFIAGGKDTEALRLVNVAVTRARHKLIIVDKEIIYDGSLNILSHKDTHESVIRKKSPRSVKMVWGDLYKEITKENHELLEQTILSKKQPEDQGDDLQIKLQELATFQSKCIHCGGEMKPN